MQPSVGSDVDHDVRVQREGVPGEGTPCTRACLRQIRSSRGIAETGPPVYRPRTSLVLALPPFLESQITSIRVSSRR